MIYFIGDKSRVFGSTKIKHSTIEDSLTYLSSLNEIGLDFETTGFDCHVNKSLTIQLGDFHRQYVIETDVVDIKVYKELIESKLILGQNLKFDIRFLFKAGIVPTKVWDTFLAETILTCGYKTIRRSLAALADRYCNVTLDKSIRGDIHRLGIVESVVEYAAKDVKYLHQIYESQKVALDKEGSYKAALLNNDFVIPLSYIEYCGIGFNKEMWLERTERDEIILDKAIKDLDNYIFEHNLTKYINYQIDMFIPNLTTSINWGSSTQVIELFKDLGLNVSVVKEGNDKESVDAKVLAKLDHPIIELYTRFSESRKAVTTYGRSFLNHINKVTGRIHTNFNQIQDTGRLSSGGKFNNGKDSYVNMQNIPRDKAFRSCFTAAEGNTLVISDYTGQEQIVLANKCMDKQLLAFYDNGFSDMHSFIATKMFQDIKDLSLEDVKKYHHDKREKAKMAGLALNYGAAGSTLSTNLGIPLEEGERIYKTYFSEFPELSKYFDKAKQEGLENGFVLISDLTGFKCYIPFHKDYLELKGLIDRSFWDNYRTAKANNSVDFAHLRDIVSRYYRSKGNIERMSLNYRIQGTGAEITKLATVMFFNWIKDNNLFDIIKIVNTIHDEIIAECPKELATIVVENLQKSMEDAGEVYCKRVLLKAEPVVSEYWTK